VKAGNNQNDRKMLASVGKVMETLLHCWWEGKMMKLLLETVGSSLKMLNRIVI
jgi:hypothetical protein